MLKKAILVLIIYFFIQDLLLNLWAKEENSLIRPPAVADQFYPADKNELSNYVKTLLARAPKKELSGQIVALIVPHAGYIFSSGVASYAYKQIEGLDFDTVIIVGLSHGYPLREISLYPKGKFETPLGLVEIDEILASNLMADNPKIKFIPEAQMDEHSLEVQMPFLQTVLKNFKIVPILINNSDYELCQSLALSISKNATGKKILLIASTDMSHYPKWSDAYNLDLETLKVLESFDPVKLTNYLKEKSKQNITNVDCLLCAEAAVLTTILAAKNLGADTVITLKYANSGDTAGDKSRVVGYGALAITRKNASFNQNLKKEVLTLFDPKVLNEEDKKELLSLARQTILQTLKNGRLAAPEVSNPKFSSNAAVFVTLWEKYQLRGCVGQTQAVYPLKEAIVVAAYQAAFGDMRFMPVEEKELKDINIEISVLSPLEKINNIDKIKLGTNGVYVSREGNAGIFLPEVATQTGWTKEEFLNHLCREKAGLPPQAWKDPATELYIFTTTVFSEEELAKK
jgi:AmmeMemoRadiSam system protein B/AmmeMemoRadiSam system protein A